MNAVTKPTTAVYDRSGHQEMTPAALAWEFMPIEQREEFLVLAEVPSTVRPRYLRCEYMFIPFAVRVKLLSAFYEWNLRLKDERTADHDGPVTHSKMVCFCGKPL